MRGVGLDEFRRRRSALEQKGQSLETQLRQLEAQVDRQAEIARVGLRMDEFCRRVRDGLDQATWEQKRQLIECLVARVIVTDGEVEIRYVIPTSPAGQATHFCHLRSDYREVLRLDQPKPAAVEGSGSDPHLRQSLSLCRLRHAPRPPIGPCFMNFGPDSERMTNDTGPLMLGMKPMPITVVARAQFTLAASCTPAARQG